MSTIDVIIVAIYVLGMLFMSFRLSKTNKTQEDYFVGGRSMPWIPVACSIAASTISANGFIGGPGWAYTSGVTAFMLQFSIPLVLMVTSTFVIPMLYNLKVTSCYEYVAMRFGNKSHIVSCVGYLVTALTLLSGFIFIPSLIINQMTGWDMLVIVPVIVLVVVAYTIMGGIKAVIWTDAIQMVVLWVGLIATVVVALQSMNMGFMQVLSEGQAAGLLNALDFSFDIVLENGVWVTLLGGAAMWAQYFFADQTQLQRMLSAKSVKAAKRSIFTSGIVMNSMMFIFMIIGVIMFSFFKGQEFESSNNVMITFVLEHLPVGILGLMLAAVFAAAMSSIDSVLNSMTTVFVKDIYEKYIRKDKGETPLKVSIMFTAVFGVITIAFVLMGFVGTTASILATVGKYAGYVAGSVLAVFLLGMFTKKANDLGTMIGFVAGVIATWGVSFTTINWLWYYLVGVVVAVVVGYVASLATGGEKEERVVYTISGQRKAIMDAGETVKDGVSILPGKMDKYAWGLLIFFFVQLGVLFLFTQ